MLGIPYYKVRYKRNGVEAIATIAGFDYLRFTNNPALFDKNYPEGMIIGDYPGGNVPYANYETPVKIAEARPIFEKKSIKTTAEGYPKATALSADDKSESGLKNLNKSEKSKSDSNDSNEKTESDLREKPLPQAKPKAHKNSQKDEDSN